MTLSRFSLAVITTLMFGCATIEPQPTTHSQFSDRIVSQIRKPFSKPVTLTHKVIVQAGRREMILTGYIMVDRTRGFRAVAVDEFGGKIFEFSHCRGRLTVDLAPPGIDVEILARGPARDLELMFLAPPEGIFSVTQRPETAKLFWKIADTQVECIIDRANLRVSRCQEDVGSRRTRLMSFGYDERSADPSIPTSIEIINRALHYRMVAQLLDVQLGVAGDLQWCQASAIPEHAN